MRGWQIVYTFTCPARNRGLCPHEKNHPLCGWIIILLPAGRQEGPFCASAGREPLKQTVCNTPETIPTHLLRRQSHSSQNRNTAIIQNVENQKILRKALQSFSFDDILSTIIGVSIGEFCPFLGSYPKIRA